MRKQRNREKITSPAASPAAPPAAPPAVIMFKESEDLNDISLKQLECPICLDPCTPPITQCRNGHNVCSRCRPMIVDCGVCKGEMTTVRNLFAEQLSQQLRYPCKFSSNGCKTKVQLRDMPKHLEECTYAIRCQMKAQSETNPRWYFPCSWEGSHCELLDHIRSKHPQRYVNAPNSEHLLELRYRTDVRLLSTRQQLFWSVLLYDFKSHTMSGKVFCIAARDVSDLYDYRYELRSDSDPDCVVSCGGKTGSAHDSNDAMMEDFLRVDAKMVPDYVIVQGPVMMKRFVIENEFRCQVTISGTKRPS